MNFDASNWQEFRFGDLISDIYKAKAINKDDLTIATDKLNAIRYITRTAENNGCELLADIRDVDKKHIEKGNAISIGDTTATCFYQEKDFITGDHMVVVRADAWLNEYTALYVVAILTNEQYKYSYGRAYLIDRIKDTIIKLPIDADGNPDWQFMEDYIKSLHHKPLTTKNKKGQAPDLKVSEWKEFRVGDILDCDTTILSIKDELLNGNTPFISRTAENNGVDGHVEIENDKITNGNCLTVGAEGIYAFYQPEPFATGNKVYQMRRQNMNKYIGLFLATVLNIEDYRYSYGRARIMSKLREEIIKLPVDFNGNPDWQFMEDYIKALPYGDRLEG